MRVGEVMEFEVDQVVTRQDHMAGLGQTAMAKKANPDLPWNTGSKGPDVVKLQSILLRWGYPIGTADGIYGAKTKKAVQLVQQKARALAATMTDPAKIARLRSLPTTGVFDGVTAALFDQVGTSEEKLVSAGEADKKAVAGASSAVVASSGPTPGVVQPAPTTADAAKPVTEAAPALTTPATGAAAPAASGGFQQYLDKVKQFTKEKPAVSAAIATAAIAGVYFLFMRRPPSNPAPAMMPAMAGLGAHKPKHKKRRKSRKSKK